MAWKICPQCPKVKISRRQEMDWHNRNHHSKHYPDFVCRECGINASSGKALNVSAYHLGFCEICLKQKPVTSPRDFFSPPFNMNGFR